MKLDTTWINDDSKSQPRIEIDAIADCKEPYWYQKRQVQERIASYPGETCETKYSYFRSVVQEEREKKRAKSSC